MNDERKVTIRVEIVHSSSDERVSVHWYRRYASDVGKPHGWQAPKVYTPSRASLDALDISLEKGVRWRNTGLRVFSYPYCLLAVWRLLK